MPARQRKKKTAEPKPPKDLRKFFKCYDSFDTIKDKLKYLLLTAHSKSKKAQ